jgi:NAD(P)-dependent dehydrogenase (short-subunit alcohol dehydrogenase family)
MIRQTTAHAGQLSHVRGIVAGGGSGIGRQIVSLFASQGARLLVLDRNGTTARESAEEAAAASGSDVLSAEVDLTDPDAVSGAVSGYAARHGLNAVVNCVGVNQFRRPADFSHAEWDSLLAVNLTGTWNLVSAAIPFLENSGQGAVVLISSVSGISGIPMAAPYTAAKHGVIGLTRALALDLGSSGTTVNAICPGVISTPLLARATTESFREQATQRTPLGRLGTTLDVAHAAEFLVSAKARWITGAVLPVDGGLTCGIRSTHWE